MAYELYNDIAMRIMDRMQHIQEILLDERADHINNLIEVLVRLRDKLNVRPTYSEGHVHNIP
jgi:hypothetical protein